MVKTKVVVAGVWAMPSGAKRQVLDSFPVGLIDLGALRHLVLAKAVAMLDNIAQSGVTMPGPPLSSRTTC